jgi:hypothetical protein
VERSSLALLDRAGLDAILAELPAVALKLVDQLARELAARDDVARQLTELHAARLAPDELERALEDRRHALARRGARVFRPTSRSLFRSLVVARGAEPSFWMLAGFVGSLVIARLVVAAILHFGLEHRLFALVPGNDPNPVHVHHFNYGIVLVVLVGMIALLPAGRRWLRLLGFAFGVGLGLIVDEFALLLHLDPNYYQRSSYVAIVVAALVLTQVIYFRGLYLGLLRRLGERVRAWRR